MARKVFEKVQHTRPRSSGFDLSHDRKMGIRLGDLVPCYVQEILPGDEFMVKTELMLRFAPMIAPVMHRIDAYVHYFFVPNRIVWSQWEDFITGGQDGTSSPTMPEIDSEDDPLYREGSLADYLGLPVNTAGVNSNKYRASALPFRAYQLIWNDYFRDETLNIELDVETATKINITTLRKRSWEKDYFTSCLPWTQRGPEVEIPATTTFTPDYKTQTEIRDSAGGGLNAGGDLQANASGLEISGAVNVYTDNLEASTEYDTTITINDLRTASALQRWLEKNARGGYRYIEQLLSHFGVVSSDKRLQRPEYLGGGKQPVVISEVLNTTGEAGGLEQGNMAGHGISVGTTNRFKRRFEEHGWVIGVLSVLPKTGYYQGVPREFTRMDKHDYYWPEFANLGEQEVFTDEVWHDFSDTQDAQIKTFGYQQRYAEYKYKQSSVHGPFRSTLEYWHMDRKFSTEPSLNAAFVQANPTNRIFAVTEGDNQNLWLQVHNNVKAKRMMPFFGIPSLR